MKRLAIVSIILFLTSNIFAKAGENHMDIAVFAGGCFWCMEGPFEAEPGVIDVKAGYTGGKTKNQIGRAHV